MCYIMNPIVVVESSVIIRKVLCPYVSFDSNSASNAGFAYIVPAYYTFYALFSIFRL